MNAYQPQFKGLWRQFVTRISIERYHSCVNSKGIANVLGNLAEVEVVEFGSHKWYPVNKKNGDDVNGYLYVDMDCCHVGKNPVLLSEASNCVILIIIDPIGTGGHFCCHMSASTKWEDMVDPLKGFFAGMNYDINRSQVFLFTENTCRFQDTKYELENVMELLNKVLTPQQLSLLADSAFLIEGQGGNCWNSYCSVRIERYFKKPNLKITFSGS